MAGRLLFSTLPPGTALDVAPFKIAIPAAEVDELNVLLKLAKFSPPTFEGVQRDRRFGLPTEWVRDATEHWADAFDWRRHEAHINSFPQYTARVPDGAGRAHATLHFTALFSARADATPLLFLHGWPGSFFEFLPILGLLRTRYSPQTLPYHVVVPSLPGYTFSSGPPVDHDFQLVDAARLIDALARGLGFSSYIAQGGDIGSRIARILGHSYPACKAVHLNFGAMQDPPGADLSLLTDSEREGLARRAKFRATGGAYALEQATRPSTLSAVLSASPVALLAWIGEKFLEWSDTDPPLDTVLAAASLYWFTQTLPRSIYPYREFFLPDANAALARMYIAKPLGFSAFPKELVPVPQAWIATTGNLVFFRAHAMGGHFAALELPDVLLKDVEDFVALVVKA